MKKLFTWVLVAIIGCGAISACDDSDDNHKEVRPTPGPTKQRTISKISAHYGYFEGYTGHYEYNFTYDESKRVVEVTSEFWENGSHQRYINIDYVSPSTISIGDGNYGDTRQVDINNLGYITCDGLSTFTYNSKGQLTNDSYYMPSDSDDGAGDSRSTIYTWSNDNIARVQQNSHGNLWNLRVKYNDKDTNAVTLDLNWFVDPMNAFGSGSVEFELATIGLMGKRCKNYITELIDEDDDWRVTYDWTYDSEGYPIECVATEYTEYANSGKMTSRYFFVYSD